MAHTMAYNAFELLEQVDAFFSARSPLDGFPPPMVFGIYTCGNFASFLWRWYAEGILDSAGSSS